MHGSTPDQIHTLVTTQVTTILTNLITWAQTELRTLAAIEQQVLPLLQALGQTMVAGCAQLQAPVAAPSTIACPCGGVARALRQRPATVITLLGRLTIPRTYYHCAACGTGQHPLDAQLAICAGRRSAGLDELLALLGATQESFAQAASVLERLTLVQVSPNTVRAATEDLGAVLVAHQTAQVVQAQTGQDVPSPPTAAPTRLYIAMDGVLAHLHNGGWREVKVGCCYQTTQNPAPQPPEHPLIRAVQPSYVTALTTAETFGWHLFAEAARRGSLAADEVVVLGDGAHWIWRVAADHFPGATEILDWYHASQYLWDAASAIWGDESPQRRPWAEAHLADLWAGQVDQVLTVLEAHRAVGAAVAAAISYYTTHCQRMDYAAYRARGLQIGSGSVESACKQVVSGRLKGPGMIWDGTGAAAVASVRAWLKSGRWAEALALRPVAQRGYQRQTSAESASEAERTAGPSRPMPESAEEPAADQHLPPAVLAAVQAELAQERTMYSWKRAWSRKQQWREAMARAGEDITATA